VGEASVSRFPVLASRILNEVRLSLLDKQVVPTFARRLIFHHPSRLSLSPTKSARLRRGILRGMNRAGFAGGSEP
jgi:hypothetical protein